MLKDFQNFYHRTVVFAEYSIDNQSNDKDFNSKLYIRTKRKLRKSWSFQEVNSYIQTVSRRIDALFYGHVSFHSIERS